MILKFGYTPKPKKFSYKPVFYTPEEEENNKKKKEELSLKEKLHASWQKERAKPKKNVKINVLVYLLVILLLLYLIFVA